MNQRRNLYYGALLTVLWVLLFGVKFEKVIIFEPSYTKYSFIPEYTSSLSAVSYAKKLNAEVIALDYYPSDGGRYFTSGETDEEIESFFREAFEELIAFYEVRLEDKENEQVMIEEELKSFSYYNEEYLLGLDSLEHICETPHGCTYAYHKALHSLERRRISTMELIQLFSSKLDTLNKAKTNTEEYVEEILNRSGLQPYNKEIPLEPDTIVKGMVIKASLYKIIQHDLQRLGKRIKNRFYPNVSSDFCLEC